MIRVTALIVAMSVAGCGLTMTQGPNPSQPADQRPVCTETFAASRRDGVGAMVGLVAILFGTIAVKGADNTTVGVPLLVGGGVVIVGAYISGGVGYMRVKKCKKAIEAFERRTVSVPPATP
ncbi:MAG TPA: hypothetical protein VMZ53_24515 [Kofleriaceae bacterium]|nr:hypothetical protein [Kofleriaceae bacterium]